MSLLPAYIDIMFRLYTCNCLIHSFLVDWFYVLKSLEEMETFVKILLYSSK